MGYSISVSGVGIQDDAAYDAQIAAIEARAAASVCVLFSGPAAARVLAVADVAGVRVTRELVRAGRCASARRERLTVLSAEVPALAHAIRLVASGLSSTRERAEWNGTAEALESAVAPAARAA